MKGRTKGSFEQLDLILNVRTGWLRTFSFMRQALSILLIFLCASSALKAQLSDSISALLEIQPKPTLRIDGRGSFVSNQAVRMLGIKVGLHHGRRFHYGIGYNFLRSAVERDRTVVENGSAITRNSRLHLRLATPWMDYAFYRNGPWQVSIPIQFGIGSGHLSYENDEGNRIKFERTFLVFYEPAMTVQYRFLKYFALSGGLGYRLAFKKRYALGERLTAPIYLLGVKVFFNDILRDSGYGPSID